MATGTALTGRTGVNISLEYLGTAEIATPKVVLSRFSPITWTYGTGANQINLLYQDQRSTDDTGETLDVTSGLFDAHGNAMTMSALKFIYVKNTHATLILEIFGNAANDLLIMDSTADAVQIPAGGEFYWSAPTAAGIVTTANKNLFVAATAAGTITYDLIMGGLD